MTKIWMWDKDRQQNELVYDVTYDHHGYPHFLVYHDGHWVRMSAKHFEPTPYEGANSYFKPGCGIGVQLDDSDYR